MEADPRWGKVRGIGQYLRSGDWSDYWRTKISYADEAKCLIRGYPLAEIIEHLSYTETLYLTLRGELPSREEVRLLNAVLSCIPDHQFISATTPSARFTASAFPESPIPGIASGILTMGSYTVSPQNSAEMINSAYDRMKKEGLDIVQTARLVVQERLQKNQRVHGLGHPTYKDVDPRAVALRKVAMECGFWRDRARLYEAIQQEFNRATGKNLPINIDGMMACVLNEMGFDPLEMAGIAALSFMCGIIAHVVEEIKEGVPLRIIPPALGSKYIGQPERHLPNQIAEAGETK